MEDVFDVCYFQLGAGVLHLVLYQGGLFGYTVFNTKTLGANNLDRRKDGLLRKWSSVSMPRSWQYDGYANKEIVFNKKHTQIDIPAAHNKTTQEHTEEA